MKKIYLMPETNVIGMTDRECLMAFSNQIDNANQKDDHNGNALEDGGEGEGGEGMGAKAWNGDWDFDPDWNFDE